MLDIDDEIYCKMMINMKSFSRDNSYALMGDYQLSMVVGSMLSMKNKIKWFNSEQRSIRLEPIGRLDYHRLLLCVSPPSDSCSSTADSHPPTLLLT